MWTIPSRERPHRLKQLIRVCQACGISTPARVMLDKDDPCLSGYQALTLPRAWTLEIGPHAGLAEIYNRTLECCPDADWYGVLCDDAVPRTEGFDLRLAEAAGTDRMAVPYVGSDTTGGAPHFVLGGSLVRSRGWLALPGLCRLYIDTVWLEIARSEGALAFLPDVVIEHHHFSNGKALYDPIYRKPNREQDRAIYQNWSQI